MLVSMMQGQLPFEIRELHRRLGPVVRIAPDELSFTAPAAWSEIYQRHPDWHRPGPWRGKPPGVTADSFVSADEQTHARLRRIFNPAFTKKAVSTYEPTITQQTAKLMRIIAREIDGSKTGKVDLDMVRWLNFCLFDIIGELGWGNSFALLDRGDYHPWVTITLGFKALLAGTCLAYYPPLDKIAGTCMPKSARDGLDMILRIARENVASRLQHQRRASTTERQDVFSHILAQGDGRTLESIQLGVQEAEMCAMSNNVAGSEPVTTTLCALLANLMRQPTAYQLLQAEIRAAFPTPGDVSVSAALALPFLMACLKETMRLAPPFPDGMRRQVGPSGAIIAGTPVPGGTVVSVSCLAAFTSADNFASPLSFRPERWLATPIVDGGLCSADFGADKHDAFHPFSYGSRACLGVNLAWAEMAMITARLLGEFDVSLPADGVLQDWESQKIFWVWEKQPLVLQLARRQQ